MPARECARAGRAGIVAANQGGQGVDFHRGLLHEQQVRALGVDQVDHIAHRGANAAQQVPANDLDPIPSRAGGVRSSRGGAPWRGWTEGRRR